MIVFQIFKYCRTPGKEKTKGKMSQFTITI